MVQRACVVPKDVAFPDAHAAVLDDDDAATGEWSGAELDRSGARVDAQIRSFGAQRVDDGVGPRSQLTSCDGWTHRTGDYRRRQYFVQTAHGVHDGVRKNEDGAPR